MLVSSNEIHNQYTWYLATLDIAYANSFCVCSYQSYNHYRGFMQS